METALKIIEAGLRAIGGVAPTVVTALTGGQSVDEAIDAARAAWRALPVREADGEWDRDLESRKRGGREA